MWAMGLGRLPHLLNQLTVGYLSLILRLPKFDKMDLPTAEQGTIEQSTVNFRNTKIKSIALYNQQYTTWSDCQNVADGLAVLKGQSLSISCIVQPHDTEFFPVTNFHAFSRYFTLTVHYHKFSTL